MRDESYKKYLLIMLMVILAFNLMDRMALGVFLEDVKNELQLTDTQLGFLSGIAFALFYSIMGIPIALWADRSNRVTIITLTTALWSAAVALCGAAGSFSQLMLIRVGVAVGEAGCVPPAHSLIADHFTRDERPRAVGIYNMGASLSFVFGYFIAGWLNQFYGWRATFILLGLPGLILAILARITIREPRQLLRGSVVDHWQPTLRQVSLTLWGNVTFRHMLYCLSVSLFFTYGVLQWQPAFFIRTYGLRTGELGTWLAVAYGLCGLVGSYCGGALACRYAAGNERLQLKAMAILYSCAGLFSTGVYLSSTYYCAFVFLSAATLVLSATNGPIFATIQTLVPPRMRATSVALVLLFSNLIGMGLGPLAAGALSDALRPFVAEESLRYALLILSPGYLWCAWHMWSGSHSVSRDLQVASKHDEEFQSIPQATESVAN